VAAIEDQPDTGHRDVQAKNYPKDIAESSALYQKAREIEEKTTKQYDVESIATGKAGALGAAEDIY